MRLASNNFKSSSPKKYLVRLVPLVRIGFLVLFGPIICGLVISLATGFLVFRGIESIPGTTRVGYIYGFPLPWRIDDHFTYIGLNILWSQFIQNSVFWIHYSYLGLFIGVIGFFFLKTLIPPTQTAKIANVFKSVSKAHLIRIGLIVLFGPIVCGLIISWLTGFLVSWPFEGGIEELTGLYGYPLVWRETYCCGNPERWLLPYFIQDLIFWVLVSYLGLIISVIGGLLLKKIIPSSGVMKTLRVRIGVSRSLFNEYLTRMGVISIFGPLICGLIISWVTGFLVSRKSTSTWPEFIMSGYPIPWLYDSFYIYWPDFIFNSIFWMVFTYLILLTVATGIVILFASISLASLLSTWFNRASK
ncbi:MAG: hypothetical protein ACFFDI_12860 [Promethearchaeota archaeon]